MNGMLDGDVALGRLTHQQAGELKKQVRVFFFVSSLRCCFCRLPHWSLSSSTTT